MFSLSHIERELRFNFTHLVRRAAKRMKSRTYLSKRRITAVQEVSHGDHVRRLGMLETELRSS